MAVKVIMPKQGLQMTEGIIVEWLVGEGESVLKDEPLFEMETDKLTITINAPVSGTLLKIVCDEGETVPITETVAIIGEPDEDIIDLLFGDEAEDVLAEPPEKAAKQQDAAAEVKQADQKEAGKPAARTFITPRARGLAASESIDYHVINGSGPDGLIIERDVQDKMKANQKIVPLAGKVATSEGEDLRDVSGKGFRHAMPEADVFASTDTRTETYVHVSEKRRLIGNRMWQSLQTAAQATHRIKVDMSEAKRLREVFRKADKSVSYNDIVSQATCRALLDHPIMNAELQDDQIVLKHYVNLGIAVAVDDGLLVPVIKNAHQLNLEELAATTKQLAYKVRHRQLSADECEGGTFTVSNLGMFGLESFVAIINPPESGILAVGRVATEPAFDDEHNVVERAQLELTLTYDHRVVDGAPAAMFLLSVKRYLEQPFLLL